MCERSSAWQRGSCLLLQYRLPVFLSSSNDKISIYRNNKIFTISLIYKIGQEWVSTLSNSSSHVQPWGVRIAYSNFSICTTTIFWMVMVQFAQQHFEWWWCNSNVYLLLGFCQFRRACFQHDNSRVAKLRKFILDQQMNININIFLPVSTIGCLLGLYYRLHAQWKVGFSLDLVGENSLSFWYREMGYKETLRERSQSLDKVTKGWSAKYWTKKQSRPSALPWISNSLQCSRPSYLTEDRRVVKKFP